MKTGSTLKPTWCGVAAAACLIALATEAGAAPVQRAFVASSPFGNDVNVASNCSRTAPCRSFTSALSVVAPGGEIIVLDSAGYGTVTISQSVSIIAPPGIYAGVTVPSGTFAGVLVTGSNLAVILRGLTVNGQGGYQGILAAAQNSEVYIDRCIVRGFPGPPGTGIRTGSANLRVYITDTEVTASTLGFFIQDGSTAFLERVRVDESSGAGLAVGSATPGMGVSVQIRDSEIHTSNEGISVSAGSPNQTMNLHVERTLVSGNTYGINLFSGDATSPVNATITASTIATNSVRGLQTFCASGGTVHAHLTDSVLTDNVNEAVNVLGAGCRVNAGRNTIARNTDSLKNSGGLLQSYGNNQIGDNTNPPSGVTTIGLQ